MRVNLILRTFSLLLITYLGFGICDAQNRDKQYTDSLQLIIDSSSDEKAVVLSYAELAAHYMRIDLDSASLFAKKGQLIAAKINFIKGMAISQVRLAQADMNADNYKSAIEGFNKAIKIYEKTEKDRDLLRAYLLNGVMSDNQQNYDQSVYYYLSGIRESEKLSDTLLMAYFFNNISIVYGFTGKQNLALDYLHRASDIFYSMGHKEYYANSIVNLGAKYKSTDSLDKAIEYFLKAEKLLLPQNNYYGLMNVYNGLGDIESSKENYEQALVYHKKAYEYSSMMNSLAVERNYGLAEIQQDLGYDYLLLKDYIKSKNLFYKVLATGKKLNSLFLQKQASDGLFHCYLELEQVDSTIYYHDLLLLINDSLHEESYNTKIEELNYEYELEKEKENFEKDKRILVLEKNRTELIYSTLIGILFTMVLIGFIIWYVQKNKLQKSELIRENLQLEKENMLNVLYKKNSELTANILNLIERNEFVAKLSERLQNYVTQKDSIKSEKIEDILRSISQDSSTNLWQEFEHVFMEVHKDFHQKLSARYPELTPNDRKLCAFILLNMSTKDISSITYQSLHSIKIARYRLRKKLGLSKNENITSFLNNL